MFGADNVELHIYHRTVLPREELLLTLLERLTHTFLKNFY